MKNKGSVLYSLIKLVLVIGIIGGSALYAKYLFDNRPEASLRKPPRAARTVTVVTAERGDHRATIHAMGTVLPARSVTITPEVSGLLEYLSDDIIPGGIIQAGQELARIDSRDYQIALKQRETEVARAEVNIRLEEGNQAVARQEYELLGESINNQQQELILRKPQLEQVQAALEAARIAQDKAKLDLSRCIVKAPFNGIVSAKSVELGARVAPGTGLLTMTGTDEYWIEVAIFTDKLSSIGIPEGNGRDGSRVQIYDEAAWGRGVYREGRVIRLLPALEEKGRMARLLISVKDPLGLNSSQKKQPRLLLDSYVRVEIEGKLLTDVIPVDWGHVRNGGDVWVMNSQRELNIKPVEFAFKDKNTVFVRSGIEPGDQIVTTLIAAPVEGMKLRLETDPLPQLEGGKAGEKSEEKPKALAVH